MTSDDDLNMMYANLARLNIVSGILDSVHYTISDDDPLIDKQELGAIASRVTFWITRLEVHIDARKHTADQDAQP